jgi:thioredoxin-related protein
MKFLVTLAAIFSCILLNAQTDSIAQPPYKRFPTVPPFRLLMPDSSTYFTKADIPKKTAVLIMAFSPDCDHCQKETTELIQNIDKFKKIQIVMATWQPFAAMRKYYVDYKLYQHENIRVGRDVSFILPPFYNIRNLPFLALYNKKGNLITVDEGSLPMTKVLELFEE